LLFKGGSVFSPAMNFDRSRAKLTSRLENWFGWAEPVETQPDGLNFDSNCPSTPFVPPWPDRPGQANIAGTPVRDGKLRAAYKRFDHV
jgi:hypothetical protein